MEQYVIKGGQPLEGEVTIAGAKNAALGILAAAVMTDQEVIIENVPNVRDTRVLLQAIEGIGAKVRYIDEHTVSICGASINPNSDLCVDDEFIRKIRASYYLLGALLGKYKRSQVALPGGCDIGARPINLHIKGFEALGAQVDITNGTISTYAEELIGSHIYMDVASVGATINIMMAAVLAEGKTTIENAAKEPHIVDVANFLNSMGANIKGAGTDRIIICGKNKLSGCEYSVMPDRIAAVTYLCCAAVTGGELILTGADIAHIGAVVPVLKDMGCRIYSFGRDSIYIKAAERLRAPHTVRTMPYPGFPTDAQAPLMATCTVADGTAVFVENIFDNRYRHVSELLRMGAVIKTEGRVAVVQGVRRLSAAEIVSPDLRGGAALVIAALGADGTSSIGGISHIDRGYESIEKALYSVGADIKRI